MSEEDPIDFQRFVETHRKRSGKSKLLPPDISYPPKWKSFCYDVLIAFKKAEKKRLGRKKFGWQAVRDAIMADFDDTAGRKIVGRDTRLTRDHLEDWKRHKKISDTAFRFVCRFVHKIDKPYIQELITDDVRRSYYERHAYTFSEVYQNRELDGSEEEFQEVVSNGFLYSAPLTKPWFKHMVIRIDYPLGSIAKITFAYCPFDLTKENPADYHRSSGIFYDGFLVPLPDFKIVEEPPSGEFNIHARNTLKYYTCLLMLFRPEHQGGPMYGYVVGSLSFQFSRWMVPRLTAIRTEVLKHNTLFEPFGFDQGFDERYRQKN